MHASFSGILTQEQLNILLKLSINNGIACSVVKFLLNSLERLVTPFPSIPQGTMCLNHSKFVLQFKAKPWVVT